MLMLVLLNRLKMMNVQFPLGSCESCNLKTGSEIVRKAFFKYLQKYSILCLFLSSLSRRLIFVSFY